MDLEKRRRLPGADGEERLLEEEEALEPAAESELVAEEESVVEEEEEVAPATAEVSLDELEADAWAREAEALEEEHERELEELEEGVDDPVRMYLREIGKVALLTADDEKFLARQMEEAGYIAGLQRRFREARGRQPTAAETVVAILEDLATLEPVRQVVARELGLDGLSLPELFQHPTFRACVDFYGGNKMVAWGEGPAPFELAAQLACPLLGLYGEEDANPSPADVAKLDAELTRLGKQHEFHSYPGAGHAFMNEGRPSYRPEAAQDAWRRALEFLSRHLR